MSMNDNGAIGWDDEVSESQASNGEEREEFVVLPEGNYPFTVNKVERTSFGGSEKLPPCGMVKVGVIVDGLDGRSYLTIRFFMHTKMLFKIYQFLEAIGLHKKGEGAGVIPWSKVVKGLTGRCHVIVRQYQGKNQNDVDRWLAPAPSADEQQGQVQPKGNLPNEY